MKKGAHNSQLKKFQQLDIDTGNDAVYDTLHEKKPWSRR